MKIVRPDDPGYDKDRVICDARFDYRPSAIYSCADANDVKRAVAAAGTLVRDGDVGEPHT
jgi:hypothetical protein